MCSDKSLKHFGGIPSGPVALLFILEIIFRTYSSDMGLKLNELFTLSSFIRCVRDGRDRTREVKHLYVQCIQTKNEKDLPKRQLTKNNKKALFNFLFASIFLSSDLFLFTLKDYVTFFCYFHY